MIGFSVNGQFKGYQKNYMLIRTFYSHWFGCVDHKAGATYEAKIQL